jgi:hypothetical protein
MTDLAFDFGAGRSFLGAFEGFGLSMTGSGLGAGGACCKALAASCRFQRSLSLDSLANLTRRSSASSFSARYALITAFGPD